MFRNIFKKQGNLHNLPFSLVLGNNLLLKITSLNFWTTGSNVDLMCKQMRQHYGPNCLQTMNIAELKVMFTTIPVTL